MAVFRIEKTRDYTVMSNHHLKDRTLTLKSKGLLSMMLSLPDEWNYTTRGLAAICREGVDSIGAALKELENHGYIRRTQLRDEKGKITDTEYVIYEMPQCEPPSSPGTPLSGTAKPYTENPDMGIPDTAEPCTENPAQLNTNQTKTDLSSTEISNPIPSNPPTPAGARMGTDRMGARECYREVILDNIEYSYLVQDSHIDREQLDEIVDLIVDTVGSTLTVPGVRRTGWTRQRPLSPQRKFSVPSVFLTRQPEKARRNFTLKKWRNAPMDACGTIRFPGRSMRSSTLPMRRCMRWNRKMWVLRPDTRARC